MTKNGASWGEKERRLTENEKAQGDKGDQWDHVAFASKEKLVVSMVPGKRTEENTKELIEDFSSRVNDGQPPCLMTADDYGPYSKYILETYGEELRPEPTGRPGRPKKPYKVAPPDLLFASVHKKRQKSRVVEVYPFTLGFLLYDVEFLGKEASQLFFAGVDLAEESAKGLDKLWKCCMIMIIKKFLFRKLPDPLKQI